MNFPVCQFYLSVKLIRFDSIVLYRIRFDSIQFDSIYLFPTPDFFVERWWCEMAILVCWSGCHTKQKMKIIILLWILCRKNTTNVRTIVVSREYLFFSLLGTETSFRMHSASLTPLISHSASLTPLISHPHDPSISSFITLPSARHSSSSLVSTTVLFVPTLRIYSDSLLQFRKLRVPTLHSSPTYNQHHRLVAKSSR